MKLNGLEFEATTIRPELRSDEFPNGFGQIWVPKKPISDIQAFIARDVHAFVAEAQKAGAVRIQATIAKTTDDDYTEWDYLGNYEQNQLRKTWIMHWDLPRTGDPTAMNILGQKADQQPRPYGSCAAPTNHIEAVLANQSRKILDNRPHTTNETFLETLELMADPKNYELLPGRSIILLQKLVEQITSSSEEAKQAYFNLLQRVNLATQRTRAEHNWNNRGWIWGFDTELNKNAALHGVYEEGYCPVVHWALPWSQPIQQNNNVWRGAIHKNRSR